MSQSIKMISLIYFCTSNSHRQVDLACFEIDYFLENRLVLNQYLMRFVIYSHYL